VAVFEKTKLSLVHICNFPYQSSLYILDEIEECQKNFAWYARNCYPCM